MELESALFELSEVLPKDPNPMVRCYGRGPENKRCKHCGHLFYKQFAGRYYKCELRGDSGSARTDQRVNWNACAKFSQK